MLNTMNKKKKIQKPKAKKKYGAGGTTGAKGILKSIKKRYKK